MMNSIRQWIAAGCVAVKSHVSYRYQPTYPNTYCLIWVRPVIGGHTYDWACLDIHYTAGGAFQALGGFWIRGIDADLKPEQEFQSPLRRASYTSLRLLAPTPPPPIRDCMNYSTVIEFLGGF